MEEIFPGTALPLELDLGSGDGTFLIEMAAAHPDRSFLGVERLAGRVEKTAKRIVEQQLTNVRVLRLETSYTLGWLLPTACASRVHLLCPDPWPKKGHHRRRLFNDPEFLGGLERVLVPQGEFLHKTDDRPYFENALEVMATQEAFTRLPWEENDFFYPQTDFERQWRALGKTMHWARWSKS